MSLESRRPRRSRAGSIRRSPTSPSRSRKRRRRSCSERSPALTWEPGRGPGLIAPLLFRNQSLGLVIALDHVVSPAISTTSTSGCWSPSPPVPQPESRPRGRWRRSDFRTRSMRPSRSAGAGPVSCTTRPFQSLAVLRMRLASALRDESPDDLHETGQEAVQQIDDEIVKLRRLITELRPASLDTIGLEAALYALAQQHQQAGEIQIECDFELSREPEERPAAVLETRSTGSCRRRSTTSPSTRSPSARSCGCASRTADRDRGLGRRRRLRAEPGARGIRAGRHARARSTARRDPEDRFDEGGGDEGVGPDPARPRPTKRVRRSEAPCVLGACGPEPQS